MNTALLLAAGSGKRMGGAVDKLFLEVCGRPVIAHSWGRWEAASCINEIVLVIREGQETRFQSLARTYGFTKPFRFITGGAERQDSVWCGLQALNPQSVVVAIHDGARPCTSASVMEQVIAAAAQDGAAVAARRVTDTIKESQTGAFIDRTIDRSRLWAVQTPQAFRVEVIRRGLEAVRERGLQVTDDTTACELIGQSVRLVEVTELNPKVTVQEDLALVELLLRGTLPESRPPTSL
jgi:2-C-methyl-D-erythritol 4-phosphate cytidylyltransferase